MLLILHEQHNASSEAQSMNKLLTIETLRKQNLAFLGTGGVSAENRSGGFRPAFHDLTSGRTALARFADGRPAPMHLLEGLPEEWVVQRDASGRISAIKDSVIAGFVRNGMFYTREQAAAALH
jgi:hypothetical protein